MPRPPMRRLLAAAVCALAALWQDGARATESGELEPGAPEPGSMHLPMSLAVVVRDGRAHARVEIENRLDNALCIPDLYIPGAAESPDGPTHVFDETRREAGRKGIHGWDIEYIYPEGVEGRGVLIIPPGKRWRLDYDLEEIFALERQRTYYARIGTFGLWCGIYEKGLPEEIQEEKGYDEYRKYHIQIISPKVVFSTGGP